MTKLIAVITGASSGIGAALARRLAAQCDGLVLHARKSVRELEAVANEVRARGATVTTVMSDLADPEIGARLATAARDSFGRLDWVVANAGFPILKSFDEGSDEDVERAFRGNAMSFFNIARAAAPLLEASAAGRIVAIGSFTSRLFRTDIRNFPMSAASKGALETAVKSLALHFAPKAITVNCVIPGLIRKPTGAEDSVSDEELAESARRIPLGHAGRPEDVAAAVAFLLSQEAGYITGQSLHVNGGLVI